jgi:hypothetical protein
MPGTEVEPRPDRAPVRVPGMPQSRRESEAAPMRAIRSARRNRHLSVPLAVPPVVWTAGEIMHAYGAGWDTLVGGALLTGCVAYFAPHKWTDKNGGPRPREVWYARLSAFALSGWLTAAAFIGPVSGSGPELAGSLVVTSAAWGWFWWEHKRPRGMKDRRKLLREWEGWWAFWAPQWSLGGSRVISASDDGITVRLRIQLWGGRQTSDDVRGAKRRMESALADFAGGGGVDVRDVKGNPSQVDARFKRRNPLAGTVEWDESRAPRSVMDPWHPGATESGRPRPVRQLGSLFVLGAKGTGKSTLLLTRLLSLCGCDDAFSILIDLKGGRSARPVLEAGAADWVITDRAEAELAYMMAEAEVLARAEGAYDGHEQITPSRVTPAIFLHVDETHRLSSVSRGSTAAANSMEAVATTGRSSVVLEDVITQYGALDASVRSEATRMNLDLRFVFRMPRADMASFAINEWASLDVSRLDGPGECYAQDAPETDPERMRGVNITHDAFRDLAPARIAKRGPKPRLKLWCGGQPCPGGGTWQEFLDSRWSRLPKALREISPQYRAWADEHGEPEEPSVSVGSAIPPVTVTTGDDTGAAVAAQIEAETQGDDIAPTPAAAARSGTAATRLEKFAAALSGAAGAGITRAALAAASGYSPSQVSAELKRLAERGAAISRDQRWFPVPGRDVLAELLAIRAGDDAMLPPGEGGGGLHLVSSAS